MVDEIASTSHPETWEIVHFGLRIANWLVGKIRHSQFEIRNAEVVGRMLVMRVVFALRAMGMMRPSLLRLFGDAGNSGLHRRALEVHHP